MTILKFKLLSFLAILQVLRFEFLNFQDFGNFVLSPMLIFMMRLYNRLCPSVLQIYRDLLGTYSFLATFSNTVSTQQESKCKSVRPSVCYAISSLTIGRNPTKFGV